MHNPNLITPMVAEQVMKDHRASAARAHRSDVISPSPRRRRFRGRRAPALHASAPRGRPTFPTAAR